MLSDWFNSEENVYGLLSALFSRFRYRRPCKYRVEYRECQSLVRNIEISFDYGYWLDLTLFVRLSISITYLVNWDSYKDLCRALVCSHILVPLNEYLNTHPLIRDE